MLDMFTYLKKSDEVLVDQIEAAAYLIKTPEEMGVFVKKVCRLLLIALAFVSILLTIVFLLKNHLLATVFVWVVTFVLISLIRSVLRWYRFSGYHQQQNLATEETPRLIRWINHRSVVRLENVAMLVQKNRLRTTRALAKIRSEDWRKAFAFATANGQISPEITQFVRDVKVLSRKKMDERDDFRMQIFEQLKKADKAARFVADFMRGYADATEQGVERAAKIAGIDIDVLKNVNFLRRSMLVSLAADTGYDLYYAARGGVLVPKPEKTLLPQGVDKSYVAILAVVAESMRLNAAATFELKYRNMLLSAWKRSGKK